MNRILLLFFMQLLTTKTLNTAFPIRKPFVKQLDNLKSLQELSPKDVAAIAGISEQTAQARIKALACLNRFENCPEINAYLTHIDEHAAQEKPLNKAPFNRLVVYLEKHTEPTTAQALVAILELPL
ncbi:MAG: hypothetical protein LVQ75_02895 [Candidatus Babeliales bacterium]